MEYEYDDGLDDGEEDGWDAEKEEEWEELQRARAKGVRAMRASAAALDILNVQLGERACAWAVHEARARGVRIDSRTLSAVLSAMGPAPAIRLLREFAAASPDALTAPAVDAAARTCIRRGKLALAREAISIGRVARVEEDARLAETVRRCASG